MLFIIKSRLCEFIHCENKVGTYEGSRRRDLLQRPVRFLAYTMGLVAGTSPLKGLHVGTC